MTKTRRNHFQVKIFISDKTPREKHAEIRLIKESIPSEVFE